MKAVKLKKSETATLAGVVAQHAFCKKNIAVVGAVGLMFELKNQIKSCFLSFDMLRLWCSC